MDVKDLRIDSIDRERNEFNNNYERKTSSSDPNYLGSNTIPKMDTQPSRPCAIIGPDRVVAQPSDNLDFKKSCHEWSYSDNVACPPFDNYEKLPKQYPSRNISPRLTYQENMQRIMMPPCHDAPNTSGMSSNFANESNVTRNLINHVVDSKFCDVPYNVTQGPLEQSSFGSSEMSSQHSAMPMIPPRGWGPTNGTHGQSFQPQFSSSGIYRYPEYSNRAMSYPVSIGHTHMIPEESSHMYPDSYYRPGNMRYEPYPSPKDRLSHIRYVSNYSVSYNPRNYQHTYMPYNQIPLKYLGPHVNDTSISGVQRSINSMQLFNSPYPTHGFPTNPTSTANTSYFSGKLPNPNESMIKLKQNVKICDNNPAKMYTEYDPSQRKSYPQSDNAYMNQISPSSNMKGSVISNFPTFNVQSLPHRPQYQRNISELSNCRSANYLPQYKIMTNDNTNHLTRLHSQFSPNVPYLNANTNLDPINSHTISQKSYSYLEERSTFNKKNIELSRAFNPGYYKKCDNAYVSHKTSAMLSKSETNPNKITLRDKKNLDVRQFLQMWNEGDEEISENNIVNTSVITVNSNENVPRNIPNSTDQLYVLDSINVPTEDLSKYEHIQKVSKLPDNIKGYSGVELLNQFEKVLSNSDMKYMYFKPDVSANYNKTFLTDNNSSERPLSPLDVEAKISQSVIHKEVGCNFEIKPCSPKSLNVDIVTPAQSLSVERQIEKVVNPNAVQALSHRLLRNENKEPCEDIKNHTQQLTVQRVEPSSCKLNENDPKMSSIDLKTNYNLQEFDTDSGVCLASLPRLDNDIEFNFPEVNQQFLDANKSDLIVNKSRNPIIEYQAITETNNKIDEQSQSSSSDDPIAIPKENSNPVSSDMKNSISLDYGNIKDGPKLSKFRKIKSNVSKVMEGNLIKSHRTCNVIVNSTNAAKEPLLEKKVFANLDKFTNVFSSPMNLTSSKSHIQNTDSFDVIQCDVNVDENKKNNSNKTSNLALHSENNQIKDSLTEITENTSCLETSNQTQHKEESDLNYNLQTSHLALHSEDNQIKNSLNEITENKSSFQNTDNFDVIQCNINMEENKNNSNKTSNLPLLLEDSQIKDSLNEFTENTSCLEITSNRTEHKQESDLNYNLQTSHIAIHSEDNQIKNSLNKITEKNSSFQNTDNCDVIQCDVNVEENKNNSNKTSNLPLLLEDSQIKDSLNEFTENTSCLEITSNRTEHKQESDLNYNLQTSHVALHSENNQIKNSLNKITEKNSSFQNTDNCDVIQCDVNVEENKKNNSNKTSNLDLLPEDKQIKDSLNEFTENISSLEITSNQIKHKQESDLNYNLQTSHLALPSEDNQIKDTLYEITENTSSFQNTDNFDVIGCDVNVEKNEKNNSNKTSHLALHSKDNRIKDITERKITENTSIFQNADNSEGDVKIEKNNLFKANNLPLKSEGNQIKDSLNEITENTSCLEITFNQTEHKQKSDLNYNLQCADKYIVDSINSIKISKNKVAISENDIVDTLELNSKKGNTLINGKSILVNENLINVGDSTVQTSIFSDITRNNNSKNVISGYYINKNNIQQISKCDDLNTYNKVNFSIDKYETEPTQQVEINVDNVHTSNDSIDIISSTSEVVHKTITSNNPLDNVEKNTYVNTQNISNFTSIDSNLRNLSDELTHNSKSVVTENLLKDQIIDNSKIKLDFQSHNSNLEISSHSLDSQNNISVIYAHDKEVTIIGDEEQFDEKQAVDGMVDISRATEPIKLNLSVTANQEFINQCSEEVNMKLNEDNVANTSNSSPFNQNQEYSLKSDNIPVLELNSKPLAERLEQDPVYMTQSKHKQYSFRNGIKELSDNNLTSHSNTNFNVLESAILFSNFNTEEMFKKADVDKCATMSNNIEIPMQETKRKIICTKELFSPRIQNLLLNLEGLAKAQNETTLKSDEKRIFFKGGNVTVQSQSIPFAKILPMQSTEAIENKSNEIKNLNKARKTKASVYNYNLSNVLESDDCNKSVVLIADFACTPKNLGENTANTSLTSNDINKKNTSKNCLNKSKDFLGETTHINLKSIDYKTSYDDSVYIDDTTNEIRKSDSLETCVTYESSQYLRKKCLKEITKNFSKLGNEIPSVDNSECYVYNLVNTSAPLIIKNDDETNNLIETPQYVSKDSGEKMASTNAKMSKQKSNTMFENSTISSQSSKETKLNIPVTVNNSKEVTLYENSEGLSKSSMKKYRNTTVESNDHKSTMLNAECLKINSVDEMVSSSLKSNDHHALVTYNDSKITSKIFVEEPPNTAVNLNIHKVIVSCKNFSEAIEETTKTILNSNDNITSVVCEIETKDDRTSFVPEGFGKETKSVILTPNANEVFVKCKKAENLTKYDFMKETSQMNFKDDSNLVPIYQPSKFLSHDSIKEKSNIILNSSDYSIVSYESTERLSKSSEKGTTNTFSKLDDRKITELSKKCENEGSENLLNNCVEKISDQIQVIYESSKHLPTSSMKESKNNEKLLDENNSVINFSHAQILCEEYNIREPSKDNNKTESVFSKNAEGRSFSCSGNVNVRTIHENDFEDCDTCCKCDNLPKKSSTFKSRLKRRNVRSLSDSEILEYDLNFVQNVNSKSYHWPKKIKKNLTEDFVGTENLNETASSCRRNSVATIINDENVSVCILIDSDCLIGDELLDNTEKEESYLFQQNDILRANNSSETTVVPIENDLIEEDIIQKDYMHDSTSKDYGDFWVDDVGCIETVVSDEIHESNENSQSTYEIGGVGKSFDSLEDIFSENFDSTNMKAIYGPNIPKDDMNLIESLYKTPQMNVNEKLKMVSTSPAQGEENIPNDPASCNIQVQKDFNNICNFSTTVSTLKKDINIYTDTTSMLKNDTVQDIEHNKEISMCMPTYVDKCLKLADNSSDKFAFSTNQKSSLIQTHTQISTIQTAEKILSELNNSINTSASSFPEVSSTTSEETSSVLLKICNYDNSRMSCIKTEDLVFKKGLRCKLTEISHYGKSDGSSVDFKPLVTKAAQKYIPPMKIPNMLQVKLPLPEYTLQRLKQLKVSKDRPKSKVQLGVNTKVKPNFEDVLKSIDEMQYKLHKSKCKVKQAIPKVIIKKSENGSHYASTSKQIHNPDLTGRKWQPWVFLEKNKFIDKMAIKRKTKAIYCHSRNAYVITDKLQNNSKTEKCTGSSTKLVICRPRDKLKMPLKYTVRLKSS